MLSNERDRISLPSDPQALSILKTLIDNILNSKMNPKYRTIKLSNSKISRFIARNADAMAFLRYLGFSLDAQRGTLTLALEPSVDFMVLENGLRLVCDAQRSQGFLTSKRKEDHEIQQALERMRLLESFEAEHSSSGDADKVVEKGSAAFQTRETQKQCDVRVVLNTLSGDSSVLVLPMQATLAHIKEHVCHNLGLAVLQQELIQVLLWDHILNPSKALVLILRICRI
jgi:hypothetical protein